MADLDAKASLTVQKAFDAWLTDTNLGQVCHNIANETALALGDFKNLLGAFAARLAKGEAAETAWPMACREHKLKGRQIPLTSCPELLGRAKGLDDHANAIAKASGGALTCGEARRLLLKHAGSLKLIGWETFLRGAPLGNYLVWATFDKDHPEADPFDFLPKSREEIRTILGLGHITASDTLILLAWDHIDSGSPPLHRPTVADAESYPYYRPGLDPDAPWGLTEPLPPNVNRLPPQPEVVMPEITSQGLRLPFRIY